ncbi:DUF11 domain-containing protein [Streptomyces sp. NRRL S-495]|uniref:DUF11 domain-containing protein n=1 Tax=Streptomyces sp. NRRL S-495 TaxID=1609133 RepID=UPI0005F8DB38|nr:DUF11 domain-containing protein [Streptomyces sp. NRRL S-495]KJY33053.1 hypothetical protein VR45_20895 [Streptomyces sp. NRRL S-495]
MTEQSPARFPIAEPFTQAEPSNPNWKLAGKARLEGSLELNRPGAAGYVGMALLDQPFPSAQGVVIDFDYATEASTGANDSFGLGLCVFLIDGRQTTQAAESWYGLGYAYQHKEDLHDPERAGVTAGYVGVALDSMAIFQYYRVGDGGDQDDPELPNRIAVRGSGNLLSGFELLGVGPEVPGGFEASWQDGAHVQMCINGTVLTVRHTRGSDPVGTLATFALEGPAMTAMPETFKLGLSATVHYQATGTYRIRDLSVAPPVTVPLEMDGPRTAHAGQQVSYTIQVANLGPGDAPEVRVEGEIPAPMRNGAEQVHCRGENGAQCGTGSVTGGLHQPLKLPAGSKATITVTGTVSRTFEGTLSPTAWVTAPGNLSTQRRAQVDIQVEASPVTADYQITGQWDQTWPEDAKGWLVGYELTLAARDQRVVRWQISFDVPAGTRLNPAQTQWYQVISNGQDGTVVLASPDDTHTIDPGAPLAVSVQLLYLTQTAAGDGTLRGLHAIETTRP